MLLDYIRLSRVSLRIAAHVRFSRYQALPKCKGGLAAANGRPIMKAKWDSPFLSVTEPLEGRAYARLCSGISACLPAKSQRQGASFR